MKKCPFCDKIFDNPYKMGGHVINCELNPKIEEIRKKSIIELRKWNNINKPKIKRKINCLYCGEEFEIECTEKEFERVFYQKCCCKNHAYKYSSNKIDRNKKKKVLCKECNYEIYVSITADSKNCLCDKCRKIKKIETSQKRNKKSLRRFKIKNKKILCKYCGLEKCDIPTICNKRQLIPTLIKYFEFNKLSIGSLKFYDEYNRILNKINLDYHEKELSIPEMCEKYNYKGDFRNFNKILNSLGIKKRSLSNSQKVAIKRGRSNLPTKNLYPYKHGFHKTWEGKDVFFRSSYEENYCKELDEKRIKYDVEKIRVEYFDTQKNSDRIAIPDFYLPDTNEIIEIKSDWTYDEQNMKDKFKAYKENGYKVKLLLEGKETII